MVRCKFRCTSKEETEYEGFCIAFSPVMDDSEEDKEFWDATPSGALWFQVSNEKTAAKFEVGKSYYLDLIEAPDQTTG